MLVKAHITAKYLARWGMIALFCFGAALWFLYDGTITYPRQRERALKYEELQEEDRASEWEEIAQQRGWPTEDPGQPKLEIEFLVQRVIAGVLAVVAIPFTFLLFRTRGRWIESTETGLRTSWGPELEFSQINALDKRTWKSKGIAKIHYDHNGRRRRLVLDDWKYQTDPTTTILRAVESNIDLARIHGAAPETPAEDESNDIESAGQDQAT
jgi:hypothetical protein